MTHADLPHSGDDPADELTQHHTDLYHRLTRMKEALSAWETTKVPDDGARFRAELVGYDGALRAHFEREETQLFSFVERRLGPAREVDELTADHHALRRRLDDIDELCCAGASPEEVRPAFDRLNERFERYLLREADFLTRTWDELFPEQMMLG